MNTWIERDISEFVSGFPLAHELKGSSFLITGATGLIGSTLVRCLLRMYELYSIGLTVTCPVRNVAKAQEMFAECMGSVVLVASDLEKVSTLPKAHYDYILHAASPTSSKYFVEKPVETYSFILNSTMNLLELAKTGLVKSLVYVSSLESYGSIVNDNVITEDMQGYVNLLDVRSSYSMGKRGAECLCHFYAKEYGVPVKIARLTQTFGAGVSDSDNRVYAQFGRSIVNGTDIELHTTGESAKPYCYTTDCIAALLYILLKGKDGEAYNVANEDTFISIRDMANFLIEEFNPKVKVNISIRKDMGYAPQTLLRLSAKKLTNLGWKPKYGLREMYERMIKSITKD